MSDAVEFNAVLLTVSCASREEARHIARSLVEARLSACVHLRSHDSIFRWQDQVEEAAEYSLLIKTVPAHAEQAASLVRSTHSYALPAIMMLRCNADEATCAWLEAETGLRPAANSL